jgi:hypothetical protein
MAAIVENTRFDYRHATGDDPYYGTPADVDYLNRYPDVAAAVKSQRESGGDITSGYLHYKTLGMGEGRTYDMSLNNKPAAVTASWGSWIPGKTNFQKALVVVLASIGLYYLLKSK